MTKIIQVKSKQSYTLNGYNLFYVNYTKLKLIKNTLKVKNKIRKVSELVSKIEKSNKRHELWN